jgi:hypothetical protein
MCNKNTFLPNNETVVRVLVWERILKVSAIELVDFKCITACIHRSPDSDFWIFLNNIWRW